MPRPCRCEQEAEGDPLQAWPGSHGQGRFSFVALNLQAVTQHKQNPLADFKPRGILGMA